MSFSYNQQQQNPEKPVGVMRMRATPVILLCILVLVLMGAGCLGTKAIPVNKTTPPSILVDYHRTGGTAGANDRLVIFNNGVAVISGGSANTEISLNDTDLTFISTLFNESDFSQLQANYPAPQQSPELMTYTVTYLGKTVTAQETDIPPSLETIIGALDSILKSAGPQKSAYPTLGITS
jgi:hypothetical protein